MYNCHPLHEKRQRSVKNSLSQGSDSVTCWLELSHAAIMTIIWLGFYLLLYTLLIGIKERELLGEGSKEAELLQEIREEVK